MQFASFLLALAFVLGFVRDAGAHALHTTKNYTVEIGDMHFGIADLWGVTDFDPNRKSHSIEITQVYLGPLGSHEVPFSAAQGLIGFSVILAVLITLPVALTVRWKKKRAAA
jgi:hypothetical protein